MAVVLLDSSGLARPRPAMARSLPAMTPTSARTTPAMASGQLVTTTARHIRNEATKRITTAVQAAALRPCLSSAIGSSPQDGDCLNGVPAAPAVVCCACFLTAVLPPYLETIVSAFGPPVLDRHGWTAST